MESGLPSTQDNDTIYVITDSGETEIEKLIIRGMEFAGGGTPSTEPKILSPIGTQIDFNGESTKTITVKAVNLSEALTVAVTGMTASLQTISASDAANGIQLTLTKGQNFTSGTLRIYSSEVDKSWDVKDLHPTFISGVKLNGAQWLKTDYVPNNNTALEITFKMTQTSLTKNSSDRFFMRTAIPAGTSNSFLIFPFGEVGSQKWGTIIDTQSSQEKSSGVISSTYFYADNAKIRLENGTCTYIAGGQSFQIATGIVVPTLFDPITICGRLNSQGVEKIYNYTDVNIYEFKIWESGTLVKHYKPAIYQGVIGLYDVVNDDFISSESSTSLIALE